MKKLWCWWYWWFGGDQLRHLKIRITDFIIDCDRRIFVKLDTWLWKRTHRVDKSTALWPPLSPRPGRIAGPPPSSPLDPVYHGSTQGEPIPKCYQSSPIMIPSRELIIPRTKTSSEDMETFSKTGLLPVFHRVVDSINPLAFEPITGAQVVRERTDGRFVIQLLVGKLKEPFDFLYNQRTGRCCSYLTWSSAQKAKSRFLKRLASNKLRLQSKKDRSRT